LKTTIDEQQGEVIVEDGNGTRHFPLASSEGFAAASRAWIRAGWDAKYVYSFTWLGRPIIQLPDDMMRLQEVLYRLKPDVLIETGVAHGGSLVFYASLFQLIGRGRVVGIDIEIRPHNRQAMEAHELYPRITLVEGSSTAPEIAARIRAMIKPGERAMVVLDSNHTHTHVLAELELYAPLVSVGSYIVVCDGVMEQVVGAPRTKPEWTFDNPRRAIHDFVSDHPDFVVEEPIWPFNEGVVDQRVTYWPDAFVRRVR
jgi:cephalosporin hydroxylase